MIGNKMKGLKDEFGTERNITLDLFIFFNI